MTFLIDVSNWDEAKERFEAYERYLRSIEGQLAAGAYAFARAPWHYDTQDPRCPHDAWVESIHVEERATGERHQSRWLDIRVRLLGANHDGHIELTYKNVRSYSFVASSEHGHGDWLKDEVRLSATGLALHEIIFASGSRWSIECEDIHYEWTPLASDNIRG